MNVEPLVFRRNVDNSIILLGEWQPSVAFSNQLLEEANANQAGIKVDGNTITLEVSNGKAEYQITERGVLSVNAKLMWGSIERAEA